MVIKSIPAPRLLEKPLLPNLRHLPTPAHVYHTNVEELYVQHVFSGRLYRELIREEWDTDNPQQ